MQPIQKKYKLRKAQFTDLEKLMEFFRKAYGEQTVFQNEKFLLYYFGSTDTKGQTFENSIIGVTKDGEVVAHYGGLKYNLKIESEVLSIVWGVSAYTLPEARGAGINSGIVDCLINDNLINGVIGFTKKTAEFYKKKGYNIFSFERFSRFVFIIDFVKTNEIVKCLNEKESGNVFSDEKKTLCENQFSTTKNIIKLTKDNIGDFDFSFNVKVKVTTNRDISFLNWRLFENPFINYEVYGYIESQSVVAYIALREEKLEPLGYKVNRIIDLFGKESVIKDLINYSINQSILKEHIYIDFSKFGIMYNNLLIESNFIKLENDEASILPQVTAPIESRPNFEFIGIQSLSKTQLVNSLSKTDVYFTRIDSDRDRLSRITQINEHPVL